MKYTVLLICASLFFTIGTVNADEWMTDFSKAQEMAKKEGKTMLVNFTGSDWCGWCIKLESEVFSKSAFKKWAKENVILVKLDFPRKKISDKLQKQNKALAAKYKVRGFPTILFIDGEGKVVGKSGYMKGGPKVWTRRAAEIIYN